MSFKLGTAGAAIIKQWEGLKLKPYNDAANPPNATIGYGHLIHKGPVTQADIDTYAGYNKASAELDFVKDTQSIVDYLNDNITTDKINQNQFDALASIGYNIGQGNLEASPLLNYVNAEDFAGAESEFANHATAGGVIVPGLVARRAAEAGLFAAGEIQALASTPAGSVVTLLILGLVGFLAWKFFKN